jgi:hypothetical protein
MQTFRKLPMTAPNAAATSTDSSMGLSMITRGFHCGLRRRCEPS